MFSHVLVALRNCAVLAGAAFGLCGCYGVASEHYFAVVDLDAHESQRQLTFYRLKIRAKSYFTTSQYTAGYFDADALHQLFGEVKKPAPSGAGDTSDKTAKAVLNADSSRSGELRVSCNNQGRCKIDPSTERFTIMYGANADALAQQVQSFAESTETGKQIASLLAASTASDVFERAAAAEQNTDSAKEKAAALAKQLKATADGIGTPASADDLRKLLLGAAQAASRQLGSSTEFDTKDVNAGFAQAAATYEALSK